MAIAGEGALRQRVCRGSGCRAVFWLCRYCDRGQRYCSPGCRAQARLQQHRSANCRHQSSPEGRLDHRDRQREYRRLHARARVTDQGSVLILSPPLLQCMTARFKPRTGFVNNDVPRGTEKPWFRCAICGRSLKSLLSL